MTITKETLKIIIDWLIDSETDQWRMRMGQ